MVPSQVDKETVVNFRSSRTFSLIALAMGLGLSAMQASAQQATFHLPVAAHWGPAVLQPGDYKLSAPVGDVAHIITVFGESQTSMIMPVSAWSGQTSDRSYLELVNVSGTYFVKEYQSGASGRTFTFAVPKSVRESIADSASITEINVDFNGTK